MDSCRCLNSIGTGSVLGLTTGQLFIEPGKFAEYLDQQSVFIFIFRTLAGIEAMIGGLIIMVNSQYYFYLPLAAFLVISSLALHRFLSLKAAD